MKAKGLFLQVFGRKSPSLAAIEPNFYCNSSSVHLAAKVWEYIAAAAVSVLEHAPYLPDCAPKDWFFFIKLKKLPADATIAATAVKKDWEGVRRSSLKECVAAAVRWWFERSE